MTRRAADRVDVVASERHFVDHLAPLWNSLPEESRGRFWCGSGDRRNEIALHQARKVYGVPARPGDMEPGSQGLAVVASVGDLGRASQAAPRKRFVYTEHGCGITYASRRSSYVGSTNRPNVDLILTPNDRTRMIQESATPGIRTVSLGSSPRLDPWANYDHHRGDRPVICLSFHWDCEAFDETRSALYWYRKGLGSLLDRGWEVIGHSHPRIWATAKAVYDHWGIEPVRDFGDVMDRADVYCVDNSSTLYEFAASGRPVVAMNCGRYRTHVHHGLRFWEFIPGVQSCGIEDHPEVPGVPLAEAIETALEDPPEVQELRSAAMAEVYPVHDGNSTGRAVEAILEVLERTSVVVNMPQRPRTEFQVVNEDGVLVEDHLLTEYEASTWASKIGGRYRRVVIGPDVSPETEEALG